jgi:hypothetical protein
MKSFFSLCSAIIISWFMVYREYTPGQNLTSACLTLAPVWIFQLNNAAFLDIENSKPFAKHKPWWISSFV